MSSKKADGLFIGRFQPFHLGHLSAIRQTFNRVGFIYIGIGSAQYSNKEMNPFTKEERKEMIEKALLADGIPSDRFEVIFIPDIHDNKAWPKHVCSLTPVFDILFLGNKGLVKELFEKYGNIKMLFVDHEVPISSTKIRQTIAEGGDWKEHLDKTTIDYLESIDGIKRIREIFRK